MSVYSCCVHTHSTFCDGKATMAQMAEAACAAGVKHFGVSGHIYTPSPTEVGICMSADMTAYRAEALRLRAAYAGRMEVLLGIEWDFLSNLPVPDWADYWIGSVHDLHDEAADAWYSVDWTPEELIHCRDAWCGGDALTVAERYYDAVAQVAAMKPTILGHIDLVTKFNEGGRFLDESHPRYRAAALAALHAADPQTTLLEINTGAVARGYRSAPYPADFLLREWRTMGGRIILTSDAHTAEGILCGYDAALAAAKAAGFARASILTADGERECPLD